MSGIIVILAILVGLVAAFAIGLYGRSTRIRAGKVRPDAPPSMGEQERDDPDAQVPRSTP